MIRLQEDTLNITKGQTGTKIVSAEQYSTKNWEYFIKLQFDW